MAELEGLGFKPLPISGWVTLGKSYYFSSASITYLRNGKIIFTYCTLVIILESKNIYLKGRIMRGRDSEMFYLLVHYPNDYSSHGSARQKPGAKAFFHGSSGAQVLGLSFATFPRPVSWELTWR